MFKVPIALTLKSNSGFDAAQSWEGCAAECIITLILFLYFLNIFSISATLDMSELKCI